MWRTEWDDVLRANYNVPGALSASQLAAKLGSTKGTVIRRARQIGLALPDQRPVRRKCKGASQVASGRRAPRVYTRDLTAPEMGPPVYKDLAPPILPIVLPREPARLKPRRAVREPAPMSPWKECQWIEGEARGRQMCCAPTHNGSSWCARHYAVVYTSRREAA